MLLERGLVESEKQARSFVMAGKVIAGERRGDKPGELYSEDIVIRLKKTSSYVSRAGEKLASAIRLFDLQSEFKDKICLDIGASTGGFTDCLLQNNVKTVYSVDVGTNQLDWKLRNNPKVISFEKTDIRKFEKDPKISFDWIVADVSFISLLTIAEKIKSISSDQTKLLLMIKPQFETLKADIPEGGVIKNQDALEVTWTRVKCGFEGLGFEVLGIANSALTGRYGNQEAFMYLRL